MASDVRALLGRFAETATDADVRRLEIALSVRSKFLSSDEKKAVVSEFKKLLRNRAAVASAKPLAENKAAVNTNTTTATPKAKVAVPAAAPAAVDDEDDFELESLF